MAIWRGNNNKHVVRYAVRHDFIMSVMTNFQILTQWFPCSSLHEVNTCPLFCKHVFSPSVFHVQEYTYFQLQTTFQLNVQIKFSSNQVSINHDSTNQFGTYQVSSKQVSYACGSVVRYTLRFIYFFLITLFSHSLVIISLYSFISWHQVY